MITKIKQFFKFLKFIEEKRIECMVKSGRGWG
jgi:hypothetical protein